MRGGGEERTGVVGAKKLVDDNRNARVLATRRAGKALCRRTAEGTECSKRIQNRTPLVAGCWRQRRASSRRNARNRNGETLVERPQRRANRRINAQEIMAMKRARVIGKERNGNATLQNAGRMLSGQQQNCVR